MLRNNSQAPEFELSDHSSTKHSLAQYKGKPVVLMFHRGRFCPTTDRFLTAYQDFYARLKELGITLLSLSADKIEDQKFLAEHFRIGYPLLSDDGCAIAVKYGLYTDDRKGSLFCEPGIVIVDAEGKVAYSVISSGPKGLPSPLDLVPVLLYMHSHGGKY